MKIILNNIQYDICNCDTFTKRIFTLVGKKNINKAYYYQNENKVHTFFLFDNVDIIGINKKNIVIFKYLDVPRNKIVEISNDKNNTDIFIIPLKSSCSIKIGDNLTFVREYEI
ncbi:MAG: hypothetical protein R3Y13_00690 [bacterium]